MIFVKHLLIRHASLLKNSKYLFHIIRIICYDTKAYEFQSIRLLLVQKRQTCIIKTHESKNGFETRKYDFHCSKGEGNNFGLFSFNNI